MNLVDSVGRPLRPGAKLGQGGEGAVFRLADDPSLAIKIYSAPLTPDRVRKVQLLSSLAGPDVQRVAAWPRGLVLDARGVARGLLLPVVENAKDVHNLYGPSSRRKHFPEADWRFLLHVATNLARAFAAIHAKGLVIGDVNHGSVLVAMDGTVRLIDVDSFQVPVPGSAPLLCTVAVPLFLPPELHGASLSSVVRTANHDAFGLAVLLFQLLLLGRHPYAGVYSGNGEMPIEQAIQQHRFAYGTNAGSLGMKAPPNTVGLEILSPPVAGAFESAFSSRAPGSGRPTAAQWVRALQNMASKTVPCGRNPTHQHVGSSLVCPWCNLERNTGSFPFGVPLSAAATSMASAEHAKLMAQIAGVRLPVPATARAATTAVAVPAAVAAARTPPSAVVLLVVGLLVAVSSLIVRSAEGLLIILGLILILVGWRIPHQKRSPWKHAYANAAGEHRAALSALETANKFPSYRKAVDEVARASRDWDSIPNLKIAKYRELQTNKERDQRQEYLRSALIENATIPGIGSGRVATLAAYGIDTAAQVEYWRVRQVPQFGDKLTERLVAWRQAVERQFRFDPGRPTSPEAIARVEKELDDRRRTALESLRRAARHLAEASEFDNLAAQDAARRLTQASLALAQTQADVSAATGRVPS